MNVTYTDGTTQAFADQPLARGAQGEIYKSLDGKHVVKLYNQYNSTPDRAKQVEAITNQYNPVRGDPYWEQLYTWPDKVVRLPRLGVRMRFEGDLTRMANFFYKVSYDKLPPEKKGWWIGRVAVAIKLARAVSRMSNFGLCHSDLSDKNVLVDAFDGRMTILDCDSIVVPGVIPADVLGTPGYMAPELVARKQREQPSVVTDRHALAVLLYRWLLYKHPLLGPKQHSMDMDEDERLMLGEKALWIEHPTDTSNRPKTLCMTTEVLTPRMKHLFHRAFVEGLYTPGLRPTANLWEDALVEMFDRMLPCANPACEQRFFVAQQTGPIHCTNCGTPLRFPGGIPSLRLMNPVQRQPGVWQYENDGHYGRYIVGWPERPLYIWHAQPSIKPAPDAAKGVPPEVQPVASIRYDPSYLKWYLENHTLPDLKVGKGTDDAINWKPVPPGEMVALDTDVRLQLGAEHVARRAIVEMHPADAPGSASAAAHVPIFGRFMQRQPEFAWAQLPNPTVFSSHQWPLLQIDSTGRIRISEGAVETMRTPLSGAARPTARPAIELSFGEVVRRLPIYLVLDCSDPMSGEGLSAINLNLRALHQTLRGDPRHVSTAHISLITFGDDAERRIFLPVTQFTIPQLEAEGDCSFGAALRAVNESLDTDIQANRPGQKGDYKPAIVLMTGGVWTDHWQAEALRLARRRQRNLIEVRGICIGDGVDMQAFKSICGTIVTADAVTPDWLSRQFEIVSVAAHSQSDG